MSFDPSLPNLAHPDDDPWLFLEEVEGAKALARVDAETGRTSERFLTPAVEADAATLKALLDRPDNMVVPRRRGGLLYNFWKDAQNPKGLWRRTTQASFLSGTPEWDVLLDLDALAAEESEDWVWQGSDTRIPGHGRAILRLSRGGADAAVLREFDLIEKTFPADGFHLPEAKGDANWLVPGDIADDYWLVSSVLGGPERATHAGYARTIRLWKRGTRFEDAPTIFEIPANHMYAWASHDREGAGERIVYGDVIGFYDANIHLGDRSGPKAKIDLPSDAWFQWERGTLVVKPRSPWHIGGVTHAPDTVLAGDAEAVFAGDRRFEVLFTPGPRKTLAYFGFAGDEVALTILDDLSPRLERWRKFDGRWTSRVVEGLPAIGTAETFAFDLDNAESNGDLLTITATPTEPATLSLVPEIGAPVVLRRQPIAFDATGLVTTRHEAVASDGERIPYFVTGPSGAAGGAPVHLYGYGGFRISELPDYRTYIGKLWLERGGVSVMACIRGGGEFGTPWHDAGRGRHKGRSHEDFAAVAADLVAQGITVSSRIAAEGGSNGGLLIANMATRFAEHFGAPFCTIPLIDMRRYAKLLAGASWMAEYGDPDKPDDWAFIGPMSAYHAVPAGRVPPILIATSRRDDRVHPGHARKFAAKLQALGHEAWFYEPADGGHGYGKDAESRAKFATLGLSFLADKIGWRLIEPITP